MTLKVVTQRDGTMYLKQLKKRVSIWPTMQHSTVNQLQIWKMTQIEWNSALLWC